MFKELHNEIQKKDVLMEYNYGSIKQKSEHVILEIKSLFTFLKKYTTNLIKAVTINNYFTLIVDK